MRLRLRPARREDRELGWVWFAAALAAPVAAWAWLRLLGLGIPACTFHRMTGLPCPTCGTTRAVLAALDGRVLEAVRWNPLVVTAIAAFEAGGLIAPIWLAGTGRVPVLEGRVPVWIRIAAVVLFVANWLWLVLSGV